MDRVAPDAVEDVGGASAAVGPVDVAVASALPVADVLTALGATLSGLPEQERRARFGPNAVRLHGARPWQVLGRQLRSPLLVLLAVTAIASFFVGEHVDVVNASDAFSGVVSEALPMSRRLINEYEPAAA